MLGSHKKQKVYVGLSGGVDSSVSAALLKQEGYDVTAVFIRIALPGYPCTAGEDRREALRAAAYLDIPFIDIDLSDAYKKAVFEPALREFERGRTPNPDAVCNREIKFGLFYQFARTHGADFVATGHYAQTVHVGDEQHLRVSKDANKDQSYFLWAVTEDELRHTLFPVGHLEKTEVRALAARFGLPNASRKDSQGLCFLGDIGIEDMLLRELSHEPGHVIDEAGNTIGFHKGVRLYTLGQRHGFVVSAHSHNEAPYFVVAKDIEANTITVAHSVHPDVRETTLTLTEENWIGTADTGSYLARYRYRAALIPATLTRTESGSVVTLDGGHLVPEGQSLVLYRRNGDAMRCLGGGVIDSATLMR